jgi:hypothetical protein
MKRDDPYGSDFLIPEPVRRTVFRHYVRSGLATRADLLPEFQNSPIFIYDGEIQVGLGGEAYELREDEEMLLFTAAVSDVTRSVPPFLIGFDRDVDVQLKAVDLGDSTGAGGATQTLAAAVPSIRLPGFAHTERFFSTVPGLVESCIVRDYGIPRATPGGYYWIWAWDAMVTALVSLRWGASELAERTVRFVNAHRDDGRIPMRWTHALEPLDTQPDGALETLLASLTYALHRESGDNDLLREVSPSMMDHLATVTGLCDRRGLFPNIGFYPDLPNQFGRTEESAVAMEIAAFYAFCRVCENSALHMGDQASALTSERMISAIENSFCQVFWDPKRKFFIDAVDRKSGHRNMSYPLFSLLFLHHPPALQLIRSYLKQTSDFIKKHLVTPVGMRLLPAWDQNAGSETVSGAWYPHWDSYAIKLLRRAGYATEIMMWLGSVEVALKRLGYAPEFLGLSSSLPDDSEAWLRHGSASNLNCATGWYQALLEGVLGLDFDPGGLTIVPLALPLDEVAVHGVRHLGTRWNVEIDHSGISLQELRVDGRIQEGCLKIPKSFHDRGEHQVDLLYGEQEPKPHFAELSNAEVLNVDSGPDGVEVALQALGQVDVVFFAPADWSLFVDGTHVGAVKSEQQGHYSASLSIPGRHTLHISRRM